MISKGLLKVIEGFAWYFCSSRSKRENQGEGRRGGSKDIPRTYK